MKMMPPRIFAFSLGLMISGGSFAQTSYDCRQIADTTKRTMERVIQTGRREIGRDESQGGAMDKPKPAAEISCEADKWRAVVAAAMLNYWGASGSQGASIVLQGYMNRLISEACGRLNTELDRARSRVENVTRVPDQVVFPYTWGQ